MTGPEHYELAEQLLESAAHESDPTPRFIEAQVHATLALAAATAEPIAQSYDGLDDTSIPQAWSAAIS